MRIIKKRKLQRLLHRPQRKIPILQPLQFLPIRHRIRNLLRRRRKPRPSTSMEPRMTRQNHGVQVVTMKARNALYERSAERVPYANDLFKLHVADFSGPGFPNKRVRELDLQRCLHDLPWIRMRRSCGSEAVVEERGVAFCGCGVDVAVLWCKVPVRVVERAAVGEELNALEVLGAVSICGNAEFGVDGERVVERFGAADASGKGVAVAADEIGDEFGECVVVLLGLCRVRPRLWRVLGRR